MLVSVGYKSFKIPPRPSVNDILCYKVVLTWLGFS